MKKPLLYDRPGLYLIDGMSCVFRLCWLVPNRWDELCVLMQQCLAPAVPVARVLLLYRRLYCSFHPAVQGLYCTQEELVPLPTAASEWLQLYLLVSLSPPCFWIPDRNAKRRPRLSLHNSSIKIYSEPVEMGGNRAWKEGQTQNELFITELCYLCQRRRLSE